MSTLRRLVTVFTALLAFSSVCRGSAPTEFVDIPWNAPMADAKRIMAQREGVQLKEESADHIIYSGGSFAAHPVEHWELQFSGGQFCTGTAYLVFPRGAASDGMTYLDHEFDGYLKVLTDKYGKAAKTGHDQATWTWAVINPRTGDKQTFSIVLSGTWNPRAFKVQYSSKLPTANATPSTGVPIKSSDL